MLAAMAFASVEPLRLPRPGRVRSARIQLADGARTMAHVACYDTATTELRVAVLRGQAPLEAWCGARGFEEALVGGFFVRGGRDPSLPLGEVRTRGVARRFVAFDAPWDGVRACVHVRGGVASIGPRGEIPAQPRGDLLQAGPLLVRDGAVVFSRADDAEGFSAGESQFDSDITDGRHPRAAIGISDRDLYLVTCDGRRTGVDAGLTLDELAAFMLALGCRDAMNLDGGGSTTMFLDGKVVNHPSDKEGERKVSDAILVTLRSNGAVKK